MRGGFYVALGALIATLTVCGMSACTATPGVVARRLTDAQLRRLAAVELTSPTQGGLPNEFIDGSGFFVSKDVLVTCRHVLAPGAPLELGARRADYTVMSAGEGTLAFEGDWQLLRCAPPMPVRVLEVSHEPTPKIGTPLYIGGFTRSSGSDRREFTVIETAVAPTPATFQLSPRGFVFSSAVPKMATSGMSGGPVAVWDESADRFNVIGIYLGRWNERLPFAGDRSRGVIQLLSGCPIDEYISRRGE